MHVERLSASNFRNMESLALELTADPVVVTGANAQGKTNLLEALAVCATGRSFRSACPGELLRHGEQRSRLSATLVRHDVRHDVEIAIDPHRRYLRIDGRGIRESTRLLQIVNVVSFFPDDLRIAKGSPEERRRFLDRAIANHRPDFVAAALAYATALKSRNALLRAPGRLDPALLAAYDEQLVQHGELMHECRCETLRALSPLAANRFYTMLGATTALSLQLDSGIGSRFDAANRSSAFEFGTAFRDALAHHAAVDRARGMTSVGPHRADLNIDIAGRSARRFASQGQQRAAVLALKIAELEYLRERVGSAPILLLDDVSSELDSDRTYLLFRMVAELSTQVWVTTTGATPLPLPPSSQMFSMNLGKLTRVNELS